MHRTAPPLLARFALVGSAIAWPIAWPGVAAAEPALAAEPAEAAEGEIAVAPLRLSGDEDATWQASLAGALDRGLRRAGIEPLALVEDDATCDAPCWAERARAADRSIVVRARVTADARLYDIALEARDTDDGTVLAQSTQPCRPCGRAEVEAQLERQAAALGDRLVRLDLAPAVLFVDTDPAGAEIFVDGVRVGTAPLEVPMPAGRHRVEARLRGHEERTRELTAVRGVTERWTIALPAIDLGADQGATARPRRREPLWPTGWALTGVGVPTLAVGIAFLAIDERPYRSRCSGDDYDPVNDLCRYRWRSLVPGAVLTAVGGAMAATGVTLVVIGHRRRQRGADGSSARTRATTVRLAPAFGVHGGGLSIAGRF